MVNPLRGFSFKAHAKLGSDYWLTHDKKGNRKPEYKKPKSERGGK